MILQELYEGRFNELDIAYQDWLGKLSPSQFKDAYGMDKKTWEIRNRDWINKREAHQRPQPVGDEHLFKENADLNTAQSLGQDLEELYRTLWDAREGPENSRYELKLKKEINIIKNQLERIGYEYDVSTKRVRPTRKVAEDSQQDRNARIVAGELNDAIKQRNKELAQRKFQELEKMGYYFDNQGKLRAMGMYEGLRDPKDNPCWKGYKPVGTKKKNGRTVPNCVPKE